MANPSIAEVLDDVASSTLENLLPDLVDNVYLSNALLVRLLEREHILLDGGRDVRQPIIYGKLPRGFYQRMDSFNTARVPTKTELVFNWKQAYVDVTIDGLTELQNSGVSAVIDITEAEMQSAEMSMRDMLGYSIFRDPNTAYTDTDNTVLWDVGKGLTGLEVAIDDGTVYNSYGGVTRDASAQGTAVKANYDGVGGVTTLDLLMTDFGLAIIEPEKPDLIITTQTIWNKIWSRVQPQQRFPSGPGFNDIVRAGFAAINFNGAAVVADAHCQTGRAYMLNTKYIKFIVHKDRNIVPKTKEWQVPTNQDAKIKQLVFAGELVVQSPRLQTKVVSLT